MVRVEVQVHIPDETGAVRPEQRGEFAGLQVEHGDIVVVPGARQRAVALPVGRQAEVGAFQVAADQQQLAEFKEGVCKQGFTPERQYRLDGREVHFLARVQGGAYGRQPGLAVLQAGQHFRAGVGLGIGPAQVIDSAPQRRQVELPELPPRLAHMRTVRRCLRIEP